MAMDAGSVCKRHRRARCRSVRHHGAKALVLLTLVVIYPVLRASSIDYNTLTWSEWGEIYTSAANYSITLPKIYRTGPRVRAKILVSTEISMSDLQAGEAIFRQQISEFVEVESIDRVQLEYLQTEVYSDSEQGEYYAVLGISALPPPSSDDDSKLLSLMLPDIETERERIVQKLNYGGNVSSETVASIALFGTPMSLVDVAVDGEAFTQIYLKPWVGVQLAIASVSSVAMGITSSSNNGHYATDRDAFQDLELRFLLARRLRSLQVGVSDIIVHSPSELLPFAVYYADVGVVEVEIHVFDLEYGSPVENYLLNEDTSGLHNTVAVSFNEMEPEWEIIAMNIDTTAGELYSPITQGDTGTSGSSSVVSDLTFEIYNLSVAQLERTKWGVLDFIRSRIDEVRPSRVRFGRVGYFLTLETYNDGSESDAGEDSIFDPINSINWTLTFEVEGVSSSADLANYVSLQQKAIETSLIYELGVQVTTDNTSTTSAKFVGASDSTDSDGQNPFVSLNLTVLVDVVYGSSIILESPHFFQLHQIRCALVFLLQQVGIQDDQVVLVSANGVDFWSVADNFPGYTSNRLFFAEFRAIISDESQRRGIRSIISSPRLPSTISLYSSGELRLLEQKVDIHADGSPSWPPFLPGNFVPTPTANNTSEGFVSPLTLLLSQRNSFTYVFDDPVSDATSGVLPGATNDCPPIDNTMSTSILCTLIRFTGATAPTSPIYLRKLQSRNPLASLSIGLPPVHTWLDPRGSNSGGYPAPWVLVGDQADDNETIWTVLLASRSRFQSIRLTFGVANTTQDLSAETSFTIDLEFYSQDAATIPVVRRQQFGELTTDDPVPAFITAELPELTSFGSQVAEVDVELNVQEPRLGGLYSLSMINEVTSTDSPSCHDCMNPMNFCANKVECPAFAACASALLDEDMTLASAMLKNDAINTSIDVSWLLEDCLTPSDGTVWSTEMSEVIVTSFTCLWRLPCPLAYSSELAKQLVLTYSNAEQILTFQLLADGYATLQFMLDTNSTPGRYYEFSDWFSGDPQSVTLGMNEVMKKMYHDGLSNVATVESTLYTTTDADTGVVTAQVTITYVFLGRLPLPSIQFTETGNNDAASVEVTMPKETLHLRVTSINP